MGQHKNNPIAKLAKEGKLPPKESKKTKREVDELIMSTVANELFERFFGDYGQTIRPARHQTVVLRRQD